MDNTQVIIKQKRRKFAIITTITVVLAIIVATLCVALSYQLPWRYDMTASGLYTLSEQSKEVVAALDEPVMIGAVYATGQAEMMVESLLEEYEKLGDMVSVEYIDAVRDPSALAKYELDVAAVTNGTLIVKKGDNYRLIDNASLFSVSSEGENIFSGEQQITGAIRFISATDIPIIYFLEGHNETSLDAAMTTAVTNLGLAMYEPRALNLQQSGTIPNDASIIVIANPVEDISDNELAQLEQYLRSGGGLMLMIEPVVGSNAVITQNLNTLCNSFGLDITNNYVVEDSGEHYLSVSNLYLVPDMGPHAITQQIGAQSKQIALPVARGIGTVDYDTNAIDHEMLLVSSQDSWVRADMTIQTEDRTPDDLEGPMPLAYAVSISNVQWGNPASRVVVVGDVTFATDGNIEFQGNNDFFMNSINWIAGDRESDVISAKVIGGNSLVIRGDDFWRLAFICVVALPLIAFGAGIAVWMLRRNQ